MRYFKEGRKYDEYRFVGVKNSRYHIEIVLEAPDESYFIERSKGAMLTAKKIANAIKRPNNLVKKSDIVESKRGVRQIFYFSK